METRFKVASIAALSLLIAFIYVKPSSAERPPCDQPGKNIVSKQTKGMRIIFTNDSGRLVAGDNSVCVLFQNRGAATSADVHEVSVNFRLLVGRLEERPITAELARIGTGRYCGHVDLGRQYFTPSSYYVFVHFTDETGKKRTIRLHLEVG